MDNNLPPSLTTLAHLRHAQYLKEPRSYTLLQNMTSKRGTRLLYLMWIQRSVPRIKTYLTHGSIVAWSWLVAGALPATVRDARRKQLHCILLLMVMSTVMRICLRTRRSWSLLWQDILDQKSRERSYALTLIVFCNILADNSPLIVHIIEG
jgi:hypothetical protein